MRSHAAGNISSSLSPWSCLCPWLLTPTLRRLRSFRSPSLTASSFLSICGPYSEATLGARTTRR